MQSIRCPVVASVISVKSVKSQWFRAFPDTQSVRKRMISVRKRMISVRKRQENIKKQEKSHFFYTNLYKNTIKGYKNVRKKQRRTKIELGKCKND
jgi:hypothetical protein